MNQSEAAMDDPYERRALLLHLGDVLEAIFCLTKCADSRASIGEALQKDDSLASFAILAQIDGGMHPQDFIRRATGAFFMWPKALLDETLNRQMLAHTVQHDLFAGNEAGWTAYVNERRTEVPWFGEDLPKVPDSNGGNSNDAADPDSEAAEDAKPRRYSTWPWPANE
jgi:hypothetical protein